VAWIARDLAFIGSKCTAQEVDILEQRPEKVIVLVELMMRKSSLDKMTGIVEFVKVADVRESLARLDDGEVDVQIAVWLLGRGDHLSELVDCRRNLFVRMVVEEITCSFDPFANVRIPEYVNVNSTFPRIYYEKLRQMGK
jgi:hypothetical protein